MKLVIKLQTLPWKAFVEPESPCLSQWRTRVLELFSDYRPKCIAKDPGRCSYRVVELTSMADDPAVEKLLKTLDRELTGSKPQVTACVEGFFSAEELRRIRFMRLQVHGDNVDCENDDKPVDPDAPILCTACGYPDMGRVNTPLLVSKTARANQDIFETRRGLLVVRPHVRDLLVRWIGDQIEVGEARIADARKTGKGGDALFWVRPKEMIGDEMDRATRKRCRACGRPTECRMRILSDQAKKKGPGLYDQRPRLEHFGTGKADLALSGGYYGDLREFWQWPVVISASLLAALAESGVKGLRLSNPWCFWSAKGEATLSPEPREFGPAKSLKKERANKPKLTQSVEKLAHVPWDYDQEGFVYFQLSTPELVVMDPMLGEPDSGGAYRVKAFKKPGLYRLHVSAIKEATEEQRHTAVDSATLLFIDSAYFSKFQETWCWDDSVRSNGSTNRSYYERIARTVGTRFGICSPPPRKFKSGFQGDGAYLIDANRIERAD